MADFLQYLVKQVKSNQLSKHEAAEMLHQLEQQGIVAKQGQQNARLHPLLHRNTSDLSGLKFESSLRLADLNGERQQDVLTSAALTLAMAHAAACRMQLMGEGTNVQLLDVCWGAPMDDQDDPAELQIRLHPEHSQRVRFETQQQQGSAQPLVLIQGQASYLSRAEDRAHRQTRRIESLIQDGQSETLNDPLYPQVYLTSNGLVARLPNAAGHHGSPLQAESPALQLIHAVLQLGVIGSAYPDLQKNDFVPFQIDEVWLGQSAYPQGGWASVQRLTEKQNGVLVCQINIDVYTEDGVLCAQLKGLSLVRASSAADHPAQALPAADVVRDRTLYQLKCLFSDVFKIDIGEIEADLELENYGIDSVTITKLNQQLQQRFGELPKTLLFECQTLEQLNDYLLDHFSDICAQWSGLEQSAGSTESNVEAFQWPVLTPLLPGTELSATELAQARQSIGLDEQGNVVETRTAHVDVSTPIAIIGLAGRYPQAGDLNQFWQNLCAGRDCISEIPAERWALQDFFVEGIERAVEQGKSYSKWGGFIDGFADFDPAFFNISPREALSMDPQERLFLQCCWHVFEDAGYTRERLEKQHQRRVGVFAGITKTGYELLGPGLWQQGDKLVPRTSFSSLANRVSYFMNLQGPSMPIDTMCSSSLTAIHEACEHLRRGDCELAIAGGVNLYLHPSAYVALSAAQMLATDGRCRSFGEGGDGFVPGEGVGSVLLKPLATAERDGDPVYALIRASQINHGGKTNGYTVPSPVAQAELIRSTLDRAGLNARDIGYIEAHGTGTRLGDPIEVSGLTQAFRQDTDDSGYCALGSVKSNIGHLEAAAGIAGLSKIVLQLQHHQLVPTLHAQTINSNLNLTQTPFSLQRELTDWPSPDNGRRRLAAVSSFGAGGANAHVIVEEYQPRQRARTAHQGPALVVLSARTPAQLEESARQLLAHLNQQPQLDLTDLAYTLQVGREAMDERLGLLAATPDQLIRQLQGFIAGERQQDCFVGRVKQHREALAVFTSDSEFGETLQRWVASGKYHKLLELWVKGLAVDWVGLLWAGHKTLPAIIRLPVYPFARQRLWPALENGMNAIAIASGSGNETQIHPLLHRNTSTLAEQRYSCRFSGEEFFLADHQVGRQRVLPGVAYLEMARMALTLASSTDSDDDTDHRHQPVPGLSLSNIVWMQPLAVSEPTTVHIALSGSVEDGMTFDVYSRVDDQEEIVHSQGSARYQQPAAIPALDLAALQQACQQQRLDRAQCYQAFAEAGLNYGPGHQGIETLAIGTGQALARLRLPAAVANSGGDYCLHPSLMDSALQAAVTLSLAGETGTALPFAVDEVQIYGPCEPEMWVWVRLSNGDAPATSTVVRVDVDLCSEDGQVRIVLKGFSSRLLRSEAEQHETAAARPATPRPDLREGLDNTLLLQPGWRDLPVTDDAEPDYAGHEVWLCQPAETLRNDPQWQSQPFAVSCFDSTADAPAARFRALYLQLFQRIQQLLPRVGSRPWLVQVVIFTDHAHSDGLAALSGLLKSAQRECPALVMQLLEFPQPLSVAGMITSLHDSRALTWATHLRYDDQLQRQAAIWQSLPQQGRHELPWKDQGCYLITGGLGGLGMIFATEIALNCRQPKLILTGRSVLDSHRSAQLKTLRQHGAKVEYYSLDMADAGAVTALVQRLVAEKGHLDGILHSAGMNRDSLIGSKTEAEIDAVFGPKINGLLALDRACADLSLDFMVLFSSIAAVTGNAGQADYAAANAFMDQFAGQRNRLVAKGERHGRTLSINWPLWREGGMGVDAGNERLIRQHTGMEPLQTPAGVQALYQCLAAGASQALVVQGDVAAMQRLLLPALRVNEPVATLAARIGGSEGPTTAAEPVVVPASPVRTGAEGDSAQALQQVRLVLSECISALLDIALENIDIDEELSAFGFDSLTLTGFTNRLNDHYGLSLSPTLFFEYPTVRQLADYLLEHHADVVVSQPEPGAVVSSVAADITPEPAALVTRRSSRRQAAGRVQPVVSAPAAQQAPAVAVIGMSGRFPGADDLDGFWQNLVNGRHCISEIPAWRWRWQDYPDVRWGGFMEGIDEFDSLFFGISPREAELMDPQQRLLMTFVWQAIEDAGYSAQSLSGSQTAIFMGTGATGYEQVLASAGTPVEGNSSTSVVPSVGPNRMSFMLNLHGPSEPIETACSSSLVAIHRAMLTLATGGCDLAIAGGINTLVSPLLHMSFTKAGMLSHDGRCKTFSSQADGYVRGEGVGILVLKPLAAAEADGDHIYGVIRGSAENHGGRANSLTAPNPKAQTALLLAAYRQAGIDPRTVGYIEAHGTGTPLGDPIEIKGLKDAFKALSDQLINKTTESINSDKLAAESKVNSSKSLQAIEKQEFISKCGVGSVKTNIGHLELAAGVAGVIKVLLQMKHQTLVSTLHCDDINPHIDLHDSPFYLVRENRPWEPVYDANGVALPRRAGVSSFGFGGVNAHVVLEEYQPLSLSSADPDTAVLIPLSARTPEQLRERAERLQDWLGSHEDTRLIDLAYTLQLGRDAMDERLAMVVSSRAELLEVLQQFVAGTAAGQRYVLGNARSRRTAVGSSQPEVSASQLADWLTEGQLEALRDSWCQGHDIDWPVLYQRLPRRPRRLALPGYPFARIRHWIGMQSSPAATRTVSQPVTAGHVQDLLLPRVRQRLTGLFSRLTKIAETDIDPYESFEQYGLDSLLVKQLNEQLAAIFGGLSKTLVFEHQTLNALADYFCRSHGEACRRWLGETAVAATPQMSVSAPRTATVQAVSRPQPVGYAEPIAIIGISGRYPQAADLEGFWDNLQHGRNSIAEVPAERWSMADFYVEDPETAAKQGRSYCKWGGFIDGYADFDPLFFGIAPLEARIMDPQERLFLECCWHACENAGYGRQRFASRHQGQVAVIAGITKTGYELYGTELWRQGEAMLPRTSFSSVANRFSYFMNLRGPSLAVDTMCSSSLTAIHEGCEYLRRGDCEVAIAGGVNLYLHPASYISLCAVNMLSREGQCKSFGADGDGFVPGEGVGVVVLKPLTAAQADGDPIHGLIRASHINHGGKTNGYTVPNPNAQGELIAAALHKAGLKASELSYIEAHGTGTQLGDPIEITGLVQAFRGDTDDNGFCALGSAKSNIGHLEAAAGIAGLTKILLQMRHQQLVPSLNAETLNPNIDFARTPFVVQRQLTAWPRPQNARGEEIPRIAGLSSFGAGGANAHLIIEEYQAPETHTETASTAPLAVLLSARTEAELQARIRQLHDYLQDHPETQLPHLAYTLQVGRDAMEQRLGLLVSSYEQLLGQLQALLNGESSLADCYRGQVRQGRATVSAFTEDEELREAVDKWMQRGKFHKLLELWVQGLEIDWSQYWLGQPGLRTLELPVYPFSHERYWIVRESAEAPLQQTETRLHPLLHRNTSSLLQQRYSSRFRGSEFFLNDHRVHGRAVLPGAAYLEMARAAAARALELDNPDQPRSLTLHNVVWLTPFFATGNDDIHIRLTAMSHEQLGFEVCSDGEQLHCQGRIDLDVAELPSALDIAALQQHCRDGVIDAGRCYQLFASAGLNYGPAHRGIQALYTGQQGVLARLQLPAELLTAEPGYVLHPGLLDSAFQASIGFALRNSDADGSGPGLPFALGSLALIRPCQADMWVWIRQSRHGTGNGNGGRDGNLTLDMDLCDDAGNVCVAIRKFTCRRFDGTTTIDSTATIESPVAQAPVPVLARPAVEAETLLLQPRWVEVASAAHEEAVARASSHHVILCSFGEFPVSRLITALNRQLPEVDCQGLTLPAATENIAMAYQQACADVLALIQQWTQETSANQLIQLVVIQSKPHQSLFQGLSGLLKSAAQEYPKLRTQLLALSTDDASVAQLPEYLQQAAERPYADLRERDQVLYWQDWQPMPVLPVQGPADTLAWREGGVYLITGGAGGLGQLLAADIAATLTHSSIILVGRSQPDHRIDGLIETLRGHGARAEYRRADLSSAEDSRELIRAVVADHGRLTAILHCAGVIQDALLRHKDSRELEAVLAPKVTGLIHLDEASRDLELEFIALFSSLAGAFGSVGQADYGAANGFMDAWADYRNHLQRQGLRHGTAISINWPLWQSEGMGISAEDQRLMELRTGMKIMPAATGLRVFHDCLRCGGSQTAVLHGDIGRIESLLFSRTHATPSSVHQTFTNIPVSQHSNTVTTPVLPTTQETSQL
ncbi:SDR family NAD(P)-dependent oxidoreductase [Gynuella sunshinyii]|uniref:Polyketide synthase modules-related protein n=1 Tax=Gynuella sunshinyii YC6258 TaxID=1445510 RepID=A0A0C5VLW5_9GAMM|nr:SDR family NAD(P)-dependent oxidoreductase [Gynuella sunshinyii]AJQ95707.1 polyketide synthase modules-related protein [Gynuella sunshinyii YC6258]